MMATGFTRRVGPGPAFITGMLLASTAGLVLASAVGPISLSFAILLLAQVLRGTGPSIYGMRDRRRGARGSAFTCVSATSGTRPSAPRETLGLW